MKQADFDIGVVTTAWGDYGKFLPEWLASVEAQTYRPSRVTIIDAGLDDSLPIRLALARCPIPWRYKKIEYRGMGNARNAAVEATPAEWIMHLDADDLLKPYALDDIRTVALTRGADVVSIGAQRGREEIIYRWASTEKALARQPVCFSCAAFRRSFWEQRPYIETNDWVDSVFWVGFAHLSAKIMSTRRVGFVYRQHPGSHSRNMTPDQREEARAQYKRLAQRWDFDGDSKQAD